jgi:hypothetical protein
VYNQLEKEKGQRYSGEDEGEHIAVFSAKTTHSTIHHHLVSPHTWFKSTASGSSCTLMCRKTMGNKFVFDLGELKRQTDENCEYRWYESFKLQITMW